MTRLLVRPRHVAVGFLMGCAEVVPGVSGGTVALVCGIYARLVAAVGQATDAALMLLRGRVRAGLAALRGLDWIFLAPLAAGMAIAVLSLARLIDHLLETEPVAIAGLFVGLVLGSIVIAFRLLARVDLVAVAIVLGVALALFLLLGLHEETTGESGDGARAALWAYPLAASVAICAWILPGVSGSLLLVMMGMYSYVFAAIDERDLPPLLLFAGGAAIGIAGFSKLLTWLLEHHHDRLVATMIGLMLGSTRVLWPWPNGVDSTALGEPSGDVALVIGLVVAGCAVVIALGRLAGEEETTPDRSPAIVGAESSA